MIDQYLKKIMNNLQIEVNSMGDIKVQNSYQCSKPFSSIIVPESHFCVDDYIFGIFHDNISTCTARMFYHGDRWYNLVPQIVIGNGVIWTAEYGTLPICTTEEKYFQEMTRNDFKDLEIEDFQEMEHFNDIILRWICECRKNSK